MTIVEFPPAEHEALKKIFDEVGAQWAKGLDQRGRAGTETLDAFHKALESKS
jgi:hypothetical protein